MSKHNTTKCTIKPEKPIKSSTIIIAGALGTGCMAVSGALMVQGFLALGSSAKALILIFGGIFLQSTQVFCFYASETSNHDITQAKKLRQLGYFLLIVTITIATSGQVAGHIAADRKNELLKKNEKLRTDQIAENSEIRKTQQLNAAKQSVSIYKDSRFAGAKMTTEAKHMAEKNAVLRQKQIEQNNVLSNILDPSVMFKTIARKFNMSIEPFVLAFFYALLLTLAFEIAGIRVWRFVGNAKMRNWQYMQSLLPDRPKTDIIANNPRTDANELLQQTDADVIEIHKKTRPENKHKSIGTRKKNQAGKNMPNQTIMSEQSSGAASPEVADARNFSASEGTAEQHQHLRTLSSGAYDIGRKPEPDTFPTEQPKIWRIGLKEMLKLAKKESVTPSTRVLKAMIRKKEKIGDRMVGALMRAMLSRDIIARKGQGYQLRPDGVTAEKCNEYLAKQLERTRNA